MQYYLLHSAISWIVTFYSARTDVIYLSQFLRIFDAWSTLSYVIHKKVEEPIQLSRSYSYDTGLLNRVLSGPGKPGKYKIVKHRKTIKKVQEFFVVAKLLIKIMSDLGIRSFQPSKF